MPFNRARFDQGARDGISVAQTDGIQQAVLEVARLSGDEYEMGFCKGIRRVMLDAGKDVDCANFLLETDVKQELRDAIKAGLDSDDVKWVIDPHVHGVVGLFLDTKCIMVMYLEEGDFEETLSLLEWADEYQDRRRA